MLNPQSINNLNPSLGYPNNAYFLPQGYPSQMSVYTPQGHTMQALMNSIINSNNTCSLTQSTFTSSSVNPTLLYSNQNSNIPNVDCSRESGNILSHPVTETTASNPVSIATASMSTASVPDNITTPTQSVPVTSTPITHIPGNVNPPPEPVMIINTILSCIKSELFRKDQRSVMELIVWNFSLEEIKIAREQLFRASGSVNQKYIYKPPNDPASTNQISEHCVFSIMAKLNELDAKSHIVKFACPAEDLYKITALSAADKKDSDYEERLSSLERRVNNIENKGNIIQPQFPALSNENQFPALMNQNQATAPPNQRSNRSTLLSEILKSQKPATPGSAKRPRDNRNNEWIQVTNRRNNKPRPPAVWGKNVPKSKELLGAKFFKVFLFNYQNSATPELVKDHFIEAGVRIVDVNLRSAPDREIRSFVMRIKFKEDYNIILENLPSRTGARWYVEKKDFIWNPYTPDTPTAKDFTPRRESIFTSPKQPSAKRQNTRPYHNGTPNDHNSGTQQDSVAQQRLSIIDKVSNMITPISTTVSDARTPSFQIGGTVSLTNTPVNNSMLMNSNTQDG